MTRNKQDQKVGDNSKVIQVGGDFQYGLSYSEARQIALDVFKANFYELSDKASKIAVDRVEDFTDKLLKSLEEKGEQILSSFNDPDMQYVIYTAQKTYARSGDEDLSNMLIKILESRTEAQNRSLRQIVLNEAIETVSKLTSKQLNVLSFLFVFRNIFSTGVVDKSTLVDYLNVKIFPLFKLLPKESAEYLHMKYTGCTTDMAIAYSFESSLMKNYREVYNKDFNKSEKNVQSFLEQEVSGYMELKEFWESGHLCVMLLTQVGKALGIINLETLTGIKYDLNKFLD